VSSTPQYGATESGEEGEPHWPRYIRITDLETDGTLRTDSVRRLTPNRASEYLLRDGDILFARSGATVGKAFRFKSTLGPACFAGYLIRFRFDPDRIIPELVELWTQTFHYWDQIRESALQATIQNVSAEKYMSLRIPYVPIDEQRALVSRLQGSQTRSAMTRLKLQRQTGLLSERRHALITAAVTGELEIPAAPSARQDDSAEAPHGSGSAESLPAPRDESALEA